MAVIWGPGVERSPLMTACGIPERNPVCIQAVPGQTGDILRLLDANGAILSSWDVNGASSGANLSGAVILAPASVDRNLIQPTNDANHGLRIRGHSATQTASPILVETAAQNPLFSVDNDGHTVFAASPTSSSNVIFDIIDGVAGPFTDVVQVLRSGLGSTFGIWEVFSNHDTDTLVQLFGNSATQSGRFLEIYPDRNTLTTHINGKGDLTVGASLVAEAGATPKIGFLGAATVVRQTGASAAGIGAITDANAKAAVTALQTALANLGLVTSPA